MVPRYNPVLLRRSKSRNSHTVVNYAPTSQGNFSRVVQKGCPRTTRSPLRYISARRDISLPHLQDKAKTHNTTTVRTTLLQKTDFFSSSFFFILNLISTEAPTKTLSRKWGWWVGEDQKPSQAPCKRTQSAERAKKRGGEASASFLNWSHRDPQGSPRRTCRKVIKIWRCGS